MTPFQKAFIPREQVDAMIVELVTKWIQNDPLVVKSFADAKTPEEAEHAIREMMEFRTAQDSQFRNDVYQVAKFDDGNIIHLSIKRNDRQPIHDWRDLQEIKNQLVGPEYEAIELYPAESRRVDTANQYHLWVANDPAFRFPCGFDNGRHCTETPLGKSVNRPFEQ